MLLGPQRGSPIVVLRPGGGLTKDDAAAQGRRPATASTQASECRPGQVTVPYHVDDSFRDFRPQRYHRERQRYMSQVTLDTNDSDSGL